MATHYMVKIIGFYATFFLFMTQGMASSIQEDIIVVTGTKTDKKLKDGPVKTEVISEKEIKEHRYRDASEAILDIPGVTLVNSTAKLGKAAVMQGLGGEHVLVLIDGVPAMENSATGFDLSQISTVDIKQIEVVKGGASALYGGQAMGGVINIITKKPSEKFKTSFETSRDQYTSGKQSGDTGHNNLKASFSGKLSDTLYKLSLTHSANASVDMDESTHTKDSADFNKFIVNGLIEQSLGESHKVYFEYNRYAEESRTYIAKLKAIGDYSPIVNDGEIEGQRFKLGHKAYFFEDINFHIYGLYEKIEDKLSMERDLVDLDNELIKESEFENKRIEAQLDFSYLNDHVGTFGVVYNSHSLDQANRTKTATTNSITSVEVDDKSANTIEAYFQDDWIIDNHEIVTGIRYTYDEYFSDNFSPKINYSYQPRFIENTTFRLSYGSGYRIPNLKERFYVLDHRSFAGYIVQGNENLRPETLQSFQAGVEFAKDRRFSLSANIFLNNVDELIVTKEVESPVVTERRFSYENINKAQIRGAELSGSYAFDSGIRLGQSFTYTRAEDKRSGLIIPNRPFYLAQFRGEYTLLDEKLRLLYTLRYFGDSYGDTANTEKYSRYAESDIRINYKIVKNADIYIGMKNIFNNVRAPRADSLQVDYDQRPSFGRVLFFGVNLEG